MASVLGEGLAFLDKLGVYDVILPFLLVFTIMFAILEKTKVLGMDEYDGKKYTKKNLNSMVALVAGFLVIASSKLVYAINNILGQVVLLLLLSVLFLLLVGSFMKPTSEGVFLEKPWDMIFMIIMFVGLVAIFLSNIRIDDGTSWLEWLIDQAVSGGNTTYGAAFMLVSTVMGFMFWLTYEPKKNDKKE